jgi:putative ATP-binding cassette transporter
VNTWRQTTLRKLISVSSGYWKGEHALRACLLLSGMILLGFLQVLLAIRLNLWSADLFDALERRSTDGFLLQVGIFAALVAGVMLVNMLHIGAKRRLQIGWREWLTRHILDQWMANARHYQISLLPGDHDNPDGRIADDIRIVTESAIELIHSAFYCLMLFVSFFAILWSLSGVIEIEVAGASLPVHGHMVWLALIYAAAGSLFAFLVGGKLVEVANLRQTAEADFRFALADAREHAEAIALARRESREHLRLLHFLQPIRKVWNSQTVGLRHLMLFSSAYGVLATMFPILISSPRYLSGAISLGILMQIGQAFQQMTAALSWPIDNFPRLAEWHASADRVIGLHDAIVARLGESTSGRQEISVSTNEGASLSIRDLAIANPGNGTLVTGITSEIQPGERIIVTGDAEVGMMLFKAVCGIWIWGSGTIALPKNAEIVLLSGKPYLPPETLRDILIFSGDGRQVDDVNCVGALEKVGLGHLKDRLNAIEPWMQVLSPKEQQRLIFAHLLVRRPQWAFLAFAAEALDENERAGLLKDIFASLPETTFVVLSSQPMDDALYTRKLTLERSETSEVSVREQNLDSTRAAEAISSASGIQRLLQFIKEGMS